MPFRDDVNCFFSDIKITRIELRKCNVRNTSHVVNRACRLKSGVRFQLTSAKVLIFPDTSKCFPLVFSVNPCFLKTKTTTKPFHSPDGYSCYFPNSLFSFLRNSVIRSLDGICNSYLEINTSSSISINVYSAISCPTSVHISMPIGGLSSGCMIFF